MDTYICIYIYMAATAEAGVTSSLALHADNLLAIVYLVNCANRPRINKWRWRRWTLVAASSVGGALLRVVLEALC